MWAQNIIKEKSALYFLLKQKNMQINKKKLHIAFITNNYKPYSGGVVRSIESFRKELIKEGYEVSIITLDFGKNYSIEDKSVFRVKCPIKFEHKSNPIAVPILASYQVKKIIYKLKPDIIHTHHPFLLGKSALKTSNKLKIPIVFTYHSLYDKFLHYIPAPDKLLIPLINRRIKSFCNKINGIIVPSKHVKNLIKQKKITTLNKIIPTGIDKSFYLNPFNYKQRKNLFNLVTVSRFSKEKNINFLIDVFSKLPLEKFNFILVGFGDEQKNLQEYAYETLKLSKKNVTFIIRPHKKKLIKLYKESDLFIYASQTETQGLVTSEALAAGTPVVALNGPGQSDIIDGKNGILVKTKEEMINWIQKISENKSLHMKMQKDAFETAQMYSSETMTKKLIDFYLKMC